ncbi:hypothetical protein A3860_31400 [Niastella vici]|uniref:Uncharacterized protein n=1 Tax=Niastella vici TaxID=1703345 RepID=A0A1V9FTW6_9BACT|nr:hypothetical protein [Niastella vici]OQP61770.1 hypothetical protein A3860_31400 [Niastella vici]
MITGALLLFYISNAQSPAFDIMQLMEKQPPVSATVTEAYGQFYPKGKKSVYQQYESSVQAQINLLADESQHQSAVLSMLAGRFDQERKRYDDFIKVVIAEEPELKKKQQAATTDYFYELDNFQRVINNALDSIVKSETDYGIQAEKILKAYQRILPGFVKKAKGVIGGMNEYLNKKGYNAVLNKQDKTHKYYIQLLEVRGLWLEKIREINKLTESGAKYAADMHFYAGGKEVGGKK